MHRSASSFPVSVCGIDHDKADNAVRGWFAFDDDGARRMALLMRSRLNARGVAVLSTCNRTEIWTMEGHGDLSFHMCRAAGVAPEQYQNLFYHKQGIEVVRYLHELASGMHSALYGETNIIPQIIHSMDVSRSVGAADGVLEQLFRQAVTAAKKVHTSIRLAAADTTVARAVTQKILERVPYKDKNPRRALMIGSGEMARLVASCLVSQGYQVDMTVRDMVKADILVPAGCTAYPYEERFSLMKRHRIVVSATAGLYHTITYEEGRSYLKEGTLLVDLSMPVDIDPRLASWSGLELLTLRSMDVESPRRQELEKQALDILLPSCDSFLAWWRFHALEPDVRQMARDASVDTLWRLRDVLDSLPLAEDEKTALRESIADAGRKAFSHQLYSRRYGGLESHGKPPGDTAGQDD